MAPSPLTIGFVAVMIPLVLIPTFIIFRKIGWYDTLLPLIVPAFFANAWDVFLLRQFFMTLPVELDNAARIDGCGPWRILWHVIIPQSWPALTTVTIFSILYAWNDFCAPLIYLQTQGNWTVVLGLQSFNALYGSLGVDGAATRCDLFPGAAALFKAWSFRASRDKRRRIVKITVIGGGSTYTPELVSGFLARAGSLPTSELWLMDIDAERLAIVGGFARRMVAAQGNPFRVVLSQDQHAAIEGAAYVVTQLRVGGMAARRADEYLGQRHGLIGQETTGVGGFAKALRTIPVALRIAADVRDLAPGALLVNFTNPAGLVTEALSRWAPDVPAVGLCNVPITFKMGVVQTLQGHLEEEIAPERGELKTLGLNHLSWHRGFVLDGKDMWPQVMEALVARLKADPEPEWDVATVEALGMIPNYYLQYYYHTDRKLAAQQQWPPSRGEQVMEIERDLLQQYADPALVEPPSELMKRGGAYYSTVATQLLNAHHNGTGETHVVNVRHGGAVPGWPEDWVLELPCRVDRGGIHPLPAEPLPPVCFGLLAQVKAYELLAVEAAVNGSRRAAYQALLAHPLGPAADRVQTVLDDLLNTHRPYLPQFWTSTGGYA